MIVTSTTSQNIFKNTSGEYKVVNKKVIILYTYVWHIMDTLKGARGTRSNLFPRIKSNT
jgi:hypothetical protein